MFGKTDNQIAQDAHAAAVIPSMTFTPSEISNAHSGAVIPGTNLTPADISPHTNDPAPDTGTLAAQIAEMESMLMGRFFALAEAFNRFIAETYKGGHDFNVKI